MQAESVDGNASLSPRNLIGSTTVETLVETFALDEYLAASDIVDWKERSVEARARLLGIDREPLRTAQACFEFVRDCITHSGDCRVDAPTCRASDVLKQGAGWCYAKSHLLAALLRANGIPAGLCYQRLSVDDRGAPYSLHGYNAVYLPEVGWYRLDARGNKNGVDARFDPPTERMAFDLRLPEEFDFENIRSTPLPCVVDVLTNRHGWRAVRRHLPDIAPSEFASVGLLVRKQGGGQVAASRPEGCSSGAGPGPYSPVL